MGLLCASLQLHYSFHWAHHHHYHQHKYYSRHWLLTSGEPGCSPPFTGPTALFEYRLFPPALIFPFPLFSLHFLVPTLSPHPRLVPRLTARFWVLRSTRLTVASIIIDVMVSLTMIKTSLFLQTNKISLFCQEDGSVQQLVYE